MDADFAGGWSSGDHMNPECVLSHTGFVIMYDGCPLTWCSKLQTEIALSTTESEYIALSQAMRETIPFMNLMVEVGDVFFRFTIPNQSSIARCSKTTVAASRLQKVRGLHRGPNTLPLNIITFGSMFLMEILTSCQ